MSRIKQVVASIERKQKPSQLARLKPVREFYSEFVENHNYISSYLLGEYDEVTNSSLGNDYTEYILKPLPNFRFTGFYNNGILAFEYGFYSSCVSHLEDVTDDDITPACVVPSGIDPLPYTTYMMLEYCKEVIKRGYWYEMSELGMHYHTLLMVLDQYGCILDTEALTTFDERLAKARD